MFRTSKCNHGEKGMCINCLVNRNKQISKEQVEEKKKEFVCKHPPHMKCVRCLPKEENKSTNWIYCETSAVIRTMKSAKIVSG